MPAGGGRLLLRSRIGTSWSSGREGLILTVADTGCGMTPSVRTQAFDAFFTTKGIGGTGLGLWISREIIARHHGVLSVRSRACPNQTGTVFTIFLPLDAAAALPAPVA